MNQHGYRVSCRHVEPGYALDGAIFQSRIDNPATVFRLGGSEEHGFHASAPLFGCGHSCSDPEAAIYDLLAANGCVGIVIEPVAAPSSSVEG